MQKYRDNITIQGRGGLVPVRNARVTVYKNGTNDLATIYTDAQKSRKGNPFNSDALGGIFFYAENGRYDLLIQGAGEDLRINDILMEDVFEEVADLDSRMPAVEQVAASAQATATTAKQTADAAAQFDEDLQVNEDAAKGSALVGFGMSTDYPAGTIGWKTHRSQSRNIHKNFATDYSGNSIVVRNGEVDGYHRHFGKLAEGIDGRLHLVYRRSAQHALTAGATCFYCSSDDGARVWSAEVEAIPVDAAADQRSVSTCVTPTGRLLLIYAKVLAPSAAPTVFELRYSDDNGATTPFPLAGQVMSVPYAYARAYSRIKLIPGKDGKPYRLAWTPYYQSGSEPATYRVAVWLSDAESDGLQWAESTPIVDDSTGHNECELVAITADIWFAVTRSSNGLTLFKTTSAGAAWESLGVVTLTSTDNYVAPTLDKFCRDGKWYLLLGYCNRTTGSGDRMVWRIASVVDALESADAFGGQLVMATDMVNASGYQSPVTRPDGSVYVSGGVGYIEFKEYDAQTYSQVRFDRMDLFEKSAGAPRSLTVSSGAITVFDSHFETQVFVDTESGAATDDLDTIAGGGEGQEITFRSSTSSRDVVFKNGTGNLQLSADFRLDTTDARIILRKTGSIWVEVGRTYSDISPAALVIASGVVTVPAADGFHYVLLASEGGAATDTLTTINGGREGQMILLMTSSSSMDITVEPATGNLVMPASVTLLTTDDSVMLIKRGSFWKKFPTL